MRRHRPKRRWLRWLLFPHHVNYHIEHHLYPTIPHWDEPKAMEALRPFMIERGVMNAERIPRRVRFNPLFGRARGLD